MTKKRLVPSTYLYPAPVLLISSRDETGSPHVATICWAGVISSEPPTVGVSIRPIRRSNTLIRNDGDFVVNIPSRSLLAQADLCGFTVTEDVDKFSAAGFTALEAARVKAPLIKECPVNLECVVRQIVQLGSHDLFIAEVVAVHADEEVLDGETISVEKLSLLTYSPIVHEYRAVGEKLGTYGFVSRKENAAEQDASAKRGAAAQGQSGDARRLVGTWRLVSIEEDRLRRYRGERPKGLLWYDAGGNMAAQIMPDRLRTAYAGTLPNAEEARDALLGYTAYFGTYEVNEIERTITHQRNGNLNPGKQDVVKRRYAFQDDDRVVLSPMEGDAVYTWERIQ